MRVAVVGAGVLGASAAFHLASTGAEVVLVDRGHEGRATAAAMLSAQVPTTIMWWLSCAMVEATATRP